MLAKNKREHPTFVKTRLKQAKTLIPQLAKRVYLHKWDAPRIKRFLVMPSLYTENSEKWKNLASIDYFTQFVKAWIPFNAWYKNYYPNLKTDREAINEIKTQFNKFRNKLISLLKDRGNEGIAFKSRIAELHLELERNHIENKGERITFEEIKTEDNLKRVHQLTIKCVVYKAAGNRPKKPVPSRVLPSRFCPLVASTLSITNQSMSKQKKLLEIVIFRLKT